MYVFSKKKFIDVEDTNDPYNALALKCGWPDDINGKVFRQNDESLCAELIEVRSSFPICSNLKAYFAKREWCLTTDFIASVFVEHKIAIKLMEEWEWDELRVIFDDAGLVWSNGDKCTERTPALIKSYLPNDGKKDSIAVHSSIFYGDRKLAVDAVSFLPGRFKAMGYSEFIDYCYDRYKADYLVSARGCGKGLMVAKAVIDEYNRAPFKLTPLNGSLENVRKDIHQGLVDSKKSEPWDPSTKLKSDDPFVVSMSLTDGVFEKIRKSIDQKMIDCAMRAPYDIHISSNGFDTTARFYRNGKLVKETKAELHPDDKFNFHIGAELAFDRLFEKKPKEKKTLDLNNLKHGDKVRVRSDLKAGSWPESILVVTPSMEKFAGKVVTIESVMGLMGGDPIYTIKDFEEPWHWTPQMFELV